MKRFGLACLIITFFNALLPLLNAQSIHLESVNADNNSPLNKTFFEYKLVKIQYAELKSAMSSRGNEHHLVLQGPDINWELDMFENDIHSGDYILLLGTDRGVETYHRKPANTPMIGYLKSSRGGQARLVVADNYIAGMIELAGTKFFIEPANRIDPSLSPDYLVVYNTDNVIQKSNVLCGADLLKENQNHIKKEIKNNQNSYRTSSCYNVEIAISNDYTVFQKQGSEAAVENWNTTILTLMQGNYDNEFAYDLEFVQTASFVALSPAGDPWDGINDITTQLYKHQSWGSGGGYGGASYDVATNWSAKWSAGVIGLAWVGSVCTSNEYNCCSDYGGSNSCLRQLEAHETGHNFDCIHDGNGAPYIMAPVINCSSDWSSLSVSTVNSFVPYLGCLDPCSGGGGSAPIADFSGTPTEKCVPFTVQFTNLSTNTPTSWLWSFNGGTPSSSTLKNPPPVLYKTYGMYDVSLTVTNAYGTDTKTIKQMIFAKDKPIPSFSKMVFDNTVFFTNLTQYGTSYFWDFGDGGSSTDVNPTHQYVDDGVYTVNLKAQNECGISTTKSTVTIVTTPVALFIADTTNGCAVFTVKYINLSSKNVTNWAWEFPGGTPSTSSVFEPIVEYKIKGVFDAKLTASNSKYKSTSQRLKYITVDSTPFVDFDTLITGSVVNFTNKSNNEKNWQWDFGDGNTSSDLNPSHSYNPGTYYAKLTSGNDCGSNSIIKKIIIANLLTVNFKVDTQSGCVPFVVHYLNTSTGSIFSSWTFPGGVPSTSTDQNPIITYNSPGIYDVQLIGGNAKDTIVINNPSLIHVQKIPESDFTSNVTGSTVYFTDQSKYGNSYYWNFGDGKSSSEKSPVHQYAAEGDYIIKMISSNSCGSDTIIKTIAVYLIPKVDFGSDTTIVCGAGNIHFTSKTSLDVNTWSWKFDGGNPDTSDEKNPLVYYNKKGIYSVKLTVHNTNGENDLVKQSYIKVISTVLCPEFVFYKNSDYNEVFTYPLRSNHTSDPVIYPNPFNGNIRIQGYSISHQINIKIFDIYGREIYLQTLPVISGQYHLELNLEYLNEGTYFINFKSDTENITKSVFHSR